MVADLIQVYPQRPLYLLLWKYVLALLIVGVGTLLRLAARPYLAGADFAITLAAMLVASWVGGLAPSLIAQTLVLYLEMQWFGERSGKTHALDAKARIKGLDLIAQKARQTLHIANRLCRANADRLNAIVDAIE